MTSFHDGGAQSAAMHRPISVADARLTIELLKSQVDGDPSLKRHCDQMLEGLDQHEAHSMPRLRSVSSPLAASTAVRRNSSSSGGVAASTKKGRVEEPPLSLLLLRKYELDAMVKQGLVEADAANLTAGYFGGSEWVAVCYWILGSLVFAFVTFLLLWHQWISRAFWEVGAAIFTVMGVSFFARAILLRMPGWYRAAHNALIFTFLAATVFWAAWLPTSTGLLLDSHYMYNWTAGERPLSFVAVQSCMVLAGGLCLVIALTLWYQYREYAQTAVHFFLVTLVLLGLATSCVFSVPPMYVPSTNATASNWESHLYQVFLAITLMPSAMLFYVIKIRRDQLKRAQKVIQRDADAYTNWWNKKLANRKMLDRGRDGGWAPDDRVWARPDSPESYHAKAAEITTIVNELDKEWTSLMKVTEQKQNLNGLFMEQKYVEWNGENYVTKINESGQDEARLLLETPMKSHKLDRHDKLKQEFWRARETATARRFRQRIADVSVLFAQAYTLHPHFQNRCSEWAEGIGYHKLETPIKRRARAIQKLFRTYQGDAGCLIDLVRAEITFEDDDRENALSKLLRCLQNIRKDASVVVLNIKNRFDLDPKESKKIEKSGGFRNVSISLILDDEFATSHGVDGHICELQLQMGELKYDEKKELNVLNDEFGHARYVEWRDLQAE